MRLSMKDAKGTSRDDSCVVGVNRPNAQPVTRSELSQPSPKVRIGVVSESNLMLPHLFFRRIYLRPAGDQRQSQNEGKDDPVGRH